ncbi:hypothetical protein FPV67DRAFT_1455122 [Lyophyllum atratum]|nr:hypothetical protein FPV67DRAFT_1455122 [Lyophyllum atratum]
MSILIIVYSMQGQVDSRLERALLKFEPQQILLSSASPISSALTAPRAIQQLREGDIWCWELFWVWEGDIIGIAFASASQHYWVQAPENGEGDAYRKLPNRRSRGDYDFANITSPQSQSPPPSPPPTSTPPITTVTRTQATAAQAPALTRANSVRVPAPLLFPQRRWNDPPSYRWHPARWKWKRCTPNSSSSIKSSACPRTTTAPTAVSDVTSTHNIIGTSTTPSSTTRPQDCHYGSRSSSKHICSRPSIRGAPVKKRKFGGGAVSSPAIITITTTDAAAEGSTGLGGCTGNGVPCDE